MAEIPANFVIFVSLSIFFWYLLGIHNILTRIEENACEMTYMFEFPQYVEISLPNEVQRKYPRYSLYGYSEGSGTEDLRRMKFTGIPVLYIPGSGGSHKQGRSLASVALRKALNSRSSFHFDFFLADFSEDLSGAYGGVLSGQTQFVTECITKILSLYRKGNYEAPSSVVLIGHSAGGLVAKGLFTEPNFKKDSVLLIITLAAPHRHAVVQPDWYLTEYYSRVNDFWSQKSENLSHVTLLSLGGGERDLLVRSDLIKDANSHVNALTTGVPGVWCSMDHLSITWCKQLILTITRALFDSVDLSRKQISLDAAYIRKILHYHFIKRSAGKKYLTHPVKGAFEKNGKWVENLLRQFSVVEKKGVKETQFLMLRLINDPKHEKAVIQTLNLNIKDWIYACDAELIVGESRVCDEGVNLSNLTEIMPAQKVKRKLFQIDMFQLKEMGFTHLIVRIPPTSAFVQINVDIHRESDRVVNLAVPRMSSLTSTTVFESSADNAMYYTIHLGGFDQIWQAFHVHLEAITCKAETSHAVLTFAVPWANETRHFYHVDQVLSTSSLKLTSPRPLKWNASETATLQLILDPSCKYKLTMTPDRLGIAGQIARYFTVLLPGYIVAVILMTLRRQLESVNAGTGVPLFHNALAQSVRKYYILLQAVIIGSKILGYRLFTSVIPQPDPTTLHEAGMDFFFLPIIMFAVATALVYIAGAIVYGAIVISGQAAHVLALRFVARTFTGFVSWSEWVLSALHQLPVVVAAILMSLASATVGGLAIALAAAFYFLKLCKLYEDYLEGLMMLSLKFVARTIKNVALDGSQASTSVGSTQNEEGTNDAEGISENDEGERIVKESQAESEETEGEKTSDNGGKTDIESNEEVGNAVVNENNEGGEEKTVATVEKAAAPEPNETEGDVQSIETELSTLEEMHFHVTMCLLYVVIAATCVPSVLSWSRSFYESTHLKMDPTWYPSMVFCAAGTVLWHGGVPRPNMKLNRISSSFLFVISAFCIMFASVTHYRLPFFASAALIYLVFHQVSARWL